MACPKAILGDSWFSKAILKYVRALGNKCRVTFVFVVYSACAPQGPIGTQKAHSDSKGPGHRSQDRAHVQTAAPQRD